MTDTQFKAITAKVNDLIQLCEQLDKENRALKLEASGWADERLQLVEKTEIARNKVELMISRLKSIEQDS